MASTSLTEEHLPHPPIPLIDLVSSDDHKVPWADMEKRSLRLHREITVVNRHEPPMNQYTCTHSHGDMGLASRQSRWRCSADVLPDTDVSTFAPWTLALGRLGFVSLQICRPPFDRTRPCACRRRERQSMTDRTLSIPDALREAQLQRLEASLACKAASTTQPAKEKDKDAKASD